METIQIIVLAIVQGLTEFLPISSSAHLILVPQLVGWNDQGIAFDVATHFGTLSAVILYFRKDLLPLLHDWIKSIQNKKHYGNSLLAWGILIATIPAGIIGFILNDFAEQLRNPLIIASSTIIFGLLLWYADYSLQRKINNNISQKSEYQLTLPMMLLIGFSQAIALIPGTSRSGITITAGLLIGMSRKAAARFSFLLSIPLIMIASLLKTIDFVNSPVHIAWSDIFFGTALSAFSAYICIHYFIKLLDRVGMMPFIIYRLFLGIILFLIFS